MDNKCVICGAIIPEGRIVCPNCIRLEPIKPSFNQPIDYINIPYNRFKYSDELDTVCYASKIITKIVDKQEKMVCESIIDWAKENGYTDVILIDEEFIRSAIENEIKRRKER